MEFACCESIAKLHIFAYNLERTAKILSKIKSKSFRMWCRVGQKERADGALLENARKRGMKRN